MFNKSGLSGELMERGQSAVKGGVKSAAKGTKKGLQDFGEEAIGQLTSSDNKDPGTNEQGSQNQAQNQQMSDEEAKEFLQDLYGVKNSNNQQPASPAGSSKPADKTKPGNAGSAKQAAGIPVEDPYKDKSPEEIAKIQALQAQLHKDEYFDPTFNPTRKQVESSEEEQEREEQEKKMEDLEEKNKLKNQDLGPAVKQGTAESVVGVSG